MALPENPDNFQQSIRQRTRLPGLIAATALFAAAALKVVDQNPNFEPVPVLVEHSDSDGEETSENSSMNKFNFAKANLLLSYNQEKRVNFFNHLLQKFYNGDQLQPLQGEEQIMQKIAEAFEETTDEPDNPNKNTTQSIDLEKIEHFWMAAREKLLNEAHISPYEKTLIILMDQAIGREKLELRINLIQYPEITPEIARWLLQLDNDDLKMRIDELEDQLKRPLGVKIRDLDLPHIRIQLYRRIIEAAKNDSDLLKEFIFKNAGVYDSTISELTQIALEIVDNDDDFFKTVYEVIPGQIDHYEMLSYFRKIKTPALYRIQDLGYIKKTIERAAGLDINDHASFPAGSFLRMRGAELSPAFLQKLALDSNTNTLRVSVLEACSEESLRKLAQIPHLKDAAELELRFRDPQIIFGELGLSKDDEL